MRAGFAKSFGVVLCACAVAVGGDLNPPLGAVGPTMKTIQDAHPRTPININTAPAPADNSAVHAITAPGNYYLTGNINVPAGRSAIVVDLASDPGDDPIILDLNGFSILGEAGSIDGVRFTTVFTKRSVCDDGGCARFCYFGDGRARCFVERCGFGEPVQLRGIGLRRGRGAGCSML